MKYNNLFKPIRIGAHVLKNRIIMPAMGSAYPNTDGTVSEVMLEYFTERARGGAAVIILDCCNIDWHNSRADFRQLSLSDDSMSMSISRLAAAVQPYGAKLLTQLYHPGSRAYNPEFEVVSASPMEKNRYGMPVRGLTNAEVKEMIQKFIKGAAIAQRAGADGVEIHSGHGYLLTEFLSPLTNHREDEYGGSIENRGRMLREIVSGIRAKCGRGFLISVRLAVKDWAAGGILIEDGIEFAKMAETAGADMINITTGIGDALNTNTETQDKPEGNRIALAEAIKPHVDIPVAIVGKLRSPDMCEEILAKGTTDMVCIGRQLICDPYWPTKVREGRLDEIRKCISCSEGCYNPHGMRCALNPYVGNESQYHENQLPFARVKKKVVVVGGGPAGMQAAVTAAQRGHEVVLLEKETHLGGQLILAAVPPFKQDILQFIKYLQGEMDRNGVKYHLGVEATVEKIAELKPDKVLVATGSIPAAPPVPGVENAVQSWDILSGKVEMPKDKHVILIGGGAIGTEVALHMAEYGNHITIIEMTDKLAATQQATHRTRDLIWIQQKGMDVRLLATVKNIENNTVLYKDKDGNNVTVTGDMVVISTGQRPVGQELYDALWAKNIQTDLCGDSIKVGNIRTGTSSGFVMGYYA